MLNNQNPCFRFWIIYGGTYLKKLLDFLVHRMTLVVFSMLIQAIILILIPYCFPGLEFYVHGFLRIISGIAVLHLINNKNNPSFKIAWIVPILIFPVFGGIFYGLLGGNKLSKRSRRKLKRIERKMEQALPPIRQTGDILRQISQHSLSAANQATYITQYALCPPYQDTKAEYLPLGEIKFERLKQELREAQHYIFLEYFIIEPGIMWDSILEILRYKVRHGVEVRVIYDDIGCIRTLPNKYYRQLEDEGIKCCVFNRFRPVLSGRFNNRDHRKIAVIDGKVGFTGGINLADEYINARKRFGHWKDVSIVLTGCGVWNLTVMFLSMWGYLRGVDEHFEDFRPYLDPQQPIRANGYVQPFADSPWDDESVGENVYLNMITRANRYVYITTPYLVIDHEMATGLSNAAKSGVDVRILTPHIPDKWYVHEVTRAHYSMLLENGVRIFEYTPGFIHAKTFCSDDQFGVVGTINLDYRSLYLHMECGVWLYGTDCIADIKSDFLQTMHKSQEITLQDCHRVPWYRRLLRAFLRAFAPLM